MKSERRKAQDVAAAARPSAAPLHSSPFTLHSSLPAALLLAALGLAVYSNSFSAPFVYDGVPFIVQNASLRQLDPLKFTAGRERPVSYFTFALNYAVDGYRVWGYHAVNLAIHVAAAWTLFGLVRRTLRDSPRCAPRYGGAGPSTLRAAWLRELYSPSYALALSIAALWLVHPLETASVTYIYQRQESLMGLLYLLTLYCVLRGIRASDRNPGERGTTVPRESSAAAAGTSHASGLWFAAAVAFSLVGMGTKEVMATAPLMALWYDRVFWSSSWRELLRRRCWLYALLGATALLPVAMVLFNRQRYQSVGLLVHQVYSPVQYALSQPGVLCHYLWLCFDPRGLSLDPSWPVAKTPAAIVWPGLFVGLLLALTAWCVWRRPAWGFVGAWFFVILAPTSSVIPIIDLAYDHRMYLSLAAVCVALVLGLHAAWQFLAQRTRLPLFRRAWVPPAVMAAIVVVFGAETWLRNEVYRSATAIWQDAADKAPHNARAHYSVARELHETGDGSSETETVALAEVNEAIRLVAEAGGADLDARTLRATILERLAVNDEATGRALAADAQLAWLAGRFDEVEWYWDEANQSWAEADRSFDQAEDDLRCVIAAQQDDAAARERSARNPGVDQDAALARDQAEAWSNLGNLFARKMEADKAIQCYDRALEFDPAFGPALKNRGAARLKKGEIQQAVRDLSRAIELDGTQPGWYFMLALAQSAAGDSAGGVRTLQRAMSAGAANAETYAALGALLVKCDRRAEAERAFHGALALQPDNIPALMQLGDLLAGAGQRREAADCYRHVLAVNPNYAPAQQQLAKLPK